MFSDFLRKKSYLWVFRHAELRYHVHFSFRYYMGIILGEGANVKSQCFPYFFAKNRICGFSEMPNSDITFMSHFDITKEFILGDERANVKNRCFPIFFAKNRICGFSDMPNSNITFISHFDITKPSSLKINDFEG